VGAVSLPKPGEEVCGDGWAAEVNSSRSLVLVVDGLGHGPLAAEATRQAIEVFRANARLSPVELMGLLHDALRSTRGTAAAVAEVRFDDEEVRFVGVGNIAGTVSREGESRSLVSHNGIVGHQLRKVQEFVYPFPPGALLVLHSDGLTPHWRLDRYPGLAERDPAVIAGVLYRDCKRGRDDVTVLVLRENREPQQ
jgi:hypothetical protein